MYYAVSLPLYLFSARFIDIVTMTGHISVSEMRCLTSYPACGASVSEVQEMLIQQRHDEQNGALKNWNTNAPIP